MGVTRRGRCRKQILPRAIIREKRIGPRRTQRLIVHEAAGVCSRFTCRRRLGLSLHGFCAARHVSCVASCSAGKPKGENTAVSPTLHAQLLGQRARWPRAQNFATSTSRSPTTCANFFPFHVSFASWSRITLGSPCPDTCCGRSPSLLAARVSIRRIRRGGRCSPTIGSCLSVSVAGNSRSSARPGRPPLWRDGLACCGT